MKKIDKKSLATAIALVPVLAASAVVAQIEEIVVTAEKRSQSIQDVPLSVAALAGDDIGVGKISGLNDIALSVPGLTFNQFNVGEPRIYIRGIGNSSDSAASDQAVGTFLDEVYIGRTGGVSADLFDLERIEILRGPQGTLYGKNTNGGAINIVTKRPSQEFEAKLSGTIGSDSLKHVQALVNGGITDNVAGKLVFSYKERDGYGKNVITESDVTNMGDFSQSTIIGSSIGAANAGEDLDDAENFSIRGQVLLDISEATSLLLGADYSKDESNGTCRHLKNLEESGPLAGLWALGMSDAYRADERNCSSQFDTGQEREISGLLARLEHDMGWATMTSITAWRASEYDFVDDLTGIPLNDPAGVFTTAPENVINGVEEEASQVSQEFRFTGSIENVDWVAGFFWMEEEVEREEEFYTHYSAALTAVLPLANVGDVLFVQDNTTETIALYSQADWHVTDQWTVTYGVRWSEDEKDITQDSIDLLGTTPAGVPLILPEFTDVKASDSWSEVTHKFSVNYRPIDDLMFYATYSEGFKSGAFPSQSNLPSVAATSVEPETVDNREIGMKSEWWDNRIQFNLSYYDMEYNELQVFELSSTLLLILTNADAESKGYEASFTILPIDDLMITASYNDSDATYSDFVDVNGIDVSGNQMVLAPDAAFTVDIDYRIPLDGGSAIDFNINYAWKDDYYTSPSNAEKTKQEDIGNLGVNIAWTSSDELLKVTAWGKNLEDETQIASRIVDPTGITSESYMAPRTYGLTVTKSFN